MNFSRRRFTEAAALCRLRPIVFLVGVCLIGIGLVGIGPIAAAAPGGSYGNGSEAISPEPILSVAEDALLAGDSERALKLLKANVKWEAYHSVEFLTMLGEAALKQGEYAEAIYALQRANSSCADDCRKQKALLATAYCGLGDARRAAQVNGGRSGDVCGVTPPPLQQANVQQGIAQQQTRSKPPVATETRISNGRRPISRPEETAAQSAAVSARLAPAAVVVARSASSTTIASNAVAREIVASNATTNSTIGESTNAGYENTGKNASNYSRQAATDIVSQAKQLLAEGKASKAYLLLQPLETDFGGEPDFDYLLGVAALDAGNPGDAVFALRRVVQAKPDFLGARMEYARALFERGDYSHADIEFELLQDTQPPARAAAVIERYRTAIRQRNRFRHPQLSGFVGVGLGRDSNATAGTEDKNFGVFTINEQSRRKSSTFTQAEAGVFGSLPLTARTQVFAALRGRHQDFNQADFVSGTAASAETGISHIAGSWHWRLSGEAHHQTLDSSFNHKGRHGRFDINKALSDRWVAKLGLQAGQLRYASQLSFQDVNQTQASIALLHRGIGPRQWTIEGALIAANDDNTQSLSPFGRDVYGSRFQFGFSLGQGRLFATVSAIRSDYDGLFAGETRRDNQQSLVLNWVVEDFLAKNWVFSPELVYVNNDSDSALFDYERSWLAVNIRRRFSTESR